MDSHQQQEELNLRWKLFKDWLDNGGGRAQIEMLGLEDDLQRVQIDEDGNVVAESIRGPINAMMLAMYGGSLHPPPYSGKDQTTYSNLFNKSHFIELEQIDTEEDFDRIWNDHLDRTDHFYRGQREAIWQLYTTGQRKWIEDRLHESEESYGAFIKRMVANARTMHDGILVKYLESIGMDPQLDIAVLSFLQHHGGPTPLQDWTFSFGNAVFFAMDGLRKEGNAEADQYCSVYHIEDSGFANADLQQLFREAIESGLPDILDQSEGWARENGIDDELIKHVRSEGVLAALIIKQLAPNMVRDMASIAKLMEMSDVAPLNFFADRDDFPWLSFSMNNSLNIQNQKGVFLWNHHEAKPTEQVGREMHLMDNGSDIGYRFCRCFNINKGLEDYVRTKLEEAGITKEYIYPDPEPMNFGMDPREFAKEVYEYTRDQGGREGTLNE